LVNKLPLQQALIDGEAAVLLSNGITSFQALQGVLSSKSARASCILFLIYCISTDVI
jgi:ATP-dependent DNA ligase